MQPKPERNHILTPEQLRHMRAADKHWQDKRDERHEMTVNEGEKRT